MLQKSNSKKIVQLKYLLLIPAVCAMLFYTSCSEDGENTKSDASLSAENNTEIMQKINELAEAIMKKGELTDEESNALKLITTQNQDGDKIYTSINEYLIDSREEAVPMASIDKVPEFPGCTGDNEAKKACFSTKITSFIVNNFDTSVGDDLEISGSQRIVVQFKINKIGIIQDVKAQAGHPKLEREATRIVHQLPKMKPGMEKGKAVNVLYSLPILFKINE